MTGTMVLTLFLGALAPVVTAAPAAAAPAGKVMIVGDSISQGHEGDYTWRYRLAQHLSNAGAVPNFVGPWTGTNKLPAAYPPGWPNTASPPVHDGAYRQGISFDADNLAQWGWQMHQAKDVIQAQVQTYVPDYLLIELGFNDLAWGINSPQGTLDDLRTLISRARAAKPNVRIVIGTVVHRSPLDGFPNLPRDISDFNSLLGIAMPTISTSTSPAVMADLDLAYNPSTDTCDGLHPNVRGEYVIAKTFADTMFGAFSVGAAFGPLPASMPANLTPGPPPSITTQQVGWDIKVSWTHVFGATGYRFFYRDVTRGDVFAETVFPIFADSWTAGAIPAGHRMEFYVESMRGDLHTSSPSAIVPHTERGLPSVPNLRLSVSEAQPNAITLTWDPVADADDYHVYAAPGCDILPPPNNQYTLVQWSLGNKTTWTHGFLTDMCMNYFVVASRNGGEGAQPPMGMRESPYLVNYNHYLARYRFWDPAGVDSGDQVGRTNVGAGPDHGVVVARAYIRNKDPIADLIGDHRQWDTNPYASAKMTIAWDTATGDVSVYVHKSCAGGVCRNAFPVAFVADAASISDNDHSEFNYVTVARTGTGLNFGMAAINAFDHVCAGSLCVGPGFGRINARGTLEPFGNTYNARLVADQFPSWEIIRYPHYIRNYPLGAESWVIGIREQTTILDLNGAPQTNCVSVGSDTHVMPNWMSC
jgi:hypothetical protein